MQHKLCIGLLALAAAVILYLAYRVFANKRWIRVNALIGIITVYIAAPALKLAVKSYGFNVDAAWNESAGPRDFVAALIVIGLIILEVIFMMIESMQNKAESHHKYLHEFKTVITDSLQNEVPDDVIARNLGVPVDKVQAILMCAALAAEWASNSDDDEDD